MRTLVIGIDSGTQSTKALVLDVTKKHVVGSASVAYGLLPNLPPGAKEQHPHTWRDATAKAIRAALKQAKATAGEVKAIGVSGQQHGFVPLDKAGQVIRPAKLWCDTATAAECEGNHRTPRRGAPHDQGARQRRPSRVHRFQDSLAPETRAPKLRQARHRPAPP
ncbi:MAG: FGGY family carbohydrate kinase [Verrucomicrobia bacterium]|nr:FGGY family carbohydrate kinase [Verrucomicrobiota bacterium]